MATPTRGSKAPLRWMLALAVLVLLGAFAWLIWQPAKPEPTTYFVALLTGDSDMLSAPPILFEQATVAPLRLVADRPDAAKFIDASDAQGAGDVREIESKLKELALDEDDRLVVYVSAHGVSDDGTAYVLARDYDLRTPGSRRYSVADLIQAISRVKAATKLLVLDCSHMAVHPRLGMAANEFIPLVEEAARGVQDPHLAILLAGADLSTSPMGLGERRSVLGGAVVDALLGDADQIANGGNDDRNLSMAELRSFVVQKCTASRVAAPVPQLIGCGDAESHRRLDDLTIVRIPSSGGGSKQIADLVAAATSLATGKAPPTKPKDDGKATVVDAATPGAGAANGQSPTLAQPAAGAPAASATAAAPSTAPPAASPVAAPATSAGPPASPDATAASTTPTVPAPAASGAPAAPIAPGAATPPPPPMILAWRLRDRLNAASSSSGNPLPADYAPHLWNELDAKLVSLHLAALGASAPGAPTPASIVELIEPYVRGLDRIVSGTAARSEGLVTDSIAEARQAYEASNQRQRMQSLDPRYVQAVLDLRRNLVLANQFVEWHAAVLGASGDVGAETAPEIAQLLDALELLDRAIADFEQSHFASWDEAGPRLQSLDDRRNTVRELAARLTRQLEIEVKAISQTADAAGLRELEALIATDVATAEQRETLLAALSHATGKPSARSAEPPSWSDFVEHLRLEARLVQLADPAMRSSAPLNAALALRPSAGTADKELQRTVREAGQALRKFYGDLPERVMRRRQPQEDPQDARTVERLIALMHPRDVTATLGTTVGFVDARLEPPTEIVLTAPRSTDLREGQLTRVEWTLQLRNAPKAEVKATLVKFDAAALEVRFSESSDPIDPGAFRTYPAASEVKVVLFVRSKNPLGGSIDARTKGLVMRVTVPANTKVLQAEREARVVIPRPNRIDLTAYTVQPPLTHAEQRRTQSIELQPYPNRSTSFRFGLTNYAGEAKHLRVELIAVPSLQGPNEPFVDGGWPTGRLLDEQGQLPARLEKWTTTSLASAPVIAASDVELPADERPHAIVLKAPGAAAPAAPAPADPAAGAAAPPPAPKPPANVDVSHGLVVRLTNVDQPEEVLLKWLEVVPLRPPSYFDFEPPRLANHNVAFVARPTDVDSDGRRDLPPEIIEKPVPFVVRGDGTVFPAGRVVPAEFTANMAQAQLEIQALESVRGKQTVAIDIDGVPRAVLWDVDFDQEAVRLNNSPASIRIVRIGMPAGAQTPSLLYRTTPYIDYPKIDEKAWPIVVDVGPDRAGSFDVSRDDRPPIEIRLQVDAPWDAFNTVGDGSAVVVRWEGYGEGIYNLYYDRDVRSSIVKITEAGEIVVAATVDDIAIRLPAPGVNNKVVTLSARLSVQGVERDADTLKIVFDQSPPKIESAVVPPQIWLGTKDVDLQLEVTDLSAITGVQAWFTPKRPRGSDELDPKAADRLEIPDAGPFQPDVASSRVLALKAPAPKELGSYYVTFRVTDRSGQSSDTIADEHILKVLEKPKPVEGPLIGDLKGQVILGAKPAPAGLTVTVKEKPTFNATTDASGRFVIKSLEAGMYTLVVEGLVTSRPVKAEQPVTLAAKGDYDGKTVIKATLEWTDPPKKK